MSPQTIRTLNPPPGGWRADTSDLIVRLRWANEDIARLRAENERLRADVKCWRDAVAVEQEVAATDVAYAPASEVAGAVERADRLARVRRVAEARDAVYELEKRGGTP